MLTTLSAALSRRPRRSLLFVLVFVILAGVLGGPVAGLLQGSGGFVPTGAESQLATNEIERATGAEPAPGVVLLIRTPNGARTAAGRAASAAARTRLAGVAGIVRATPAGIAPNGREAFVAGTIRASASDDDVANAAVAAFAGRTAVSVGGAAVGAAQVNSTITKDLGFAEALAAPLLIALSILFFRGRAALMPLVTGVATVLGTFLVMRGVNELYGLSIFALNLVIGLGLGLAVDYSLFIVTRFREELARGLETGPAIAETMRHAGRTVLFSAATVAAALATLVLFPQEFLKSMGIAGAICALCAAAAAVIISPALLGLWGVKLARPVGATASGRWYRLSHAVMRHPGAVAVLAAAAMAAAAIPALGAAWSPASDPSVIPTGQSARIVADALTRDFGASTDSPVTVAVSAPRADGAAVGALARRIGRIAGVDPDPRSGERGGAPRTRALGPDLWTIDAEVRGDSVGPRAQRVVRAIRALTPRFPTRVTGDAATFIDQQAAIGSHLGLAVGLLALLTFLILWLMTGSVVLPLKALVMNVLTVGAALSAIVVIYQHGRLTGLLHYTPDGGVEPTDFVVAATVVFALSTDYGVFLLGRIKEARDRQLAGGGVVDEREAVAAGLGATGRVVTGAAVLLAVAIGAFSTSEISFIQQIGVAVAVGVLLDAFIVRSLLVPSLMALLGRWNWWSPSPIRWLHARLLVA